MEKVDLQYKALIDNLKVGVFRSSPGLKHSFIFGNKALERMLGYSAQEFMEISVADIFADNKRFGQIAREVEQHGFVEHEEVLLKRKDDKTIWCSLSIVSFREGKGKGHQFYDCVIEDISNQKRVEKELFESKELFRVIFDNSPVGITVTDKDERIIAWNSFAEMMLQMDKNDLFNKLVKELYSAKEWRRMRAFQIRKRGMLSDITTQVMRKDGSVLDVNLSICVLKDGDGNIVGSIGIMHDITRQKQAEEQLRESENKIRVILNNSAAAITLTDEHERIISWNTFTEHMFGMKKKDLYLKPVSSLYPVKEWKRIRAEGIRQKGSRHHFETQVIKKDGKLLDVDLSVNVLKDSNNKILGSVGILQDITQQKRIREMLLQSKIMAEEANNAKSLFLAKMSHEVRTPMNAIIGMIDLTLDTKLTDEQKDNLKVARDASENLLGLINDILDLSKAEAGKIAIEEIEMDVHDIVKNVCKGLTVLARNKQIDILWSIDPQVPRFLIGDPVRLRQIVINLVNNAIKFTHKGKIEIKAAIKSKKDNECEVLFSVKDSGIGIPADKHEKIFEIFSQADDHTSRKYGGTGLGLAICKKLAEMMGGRIWVESEEGKGSTFLFTILYKIPKDIVGRKVAVDSSDAQNSDALPGEFAHLRVLLAEDNLVNQKIILKMLEKQGWNISPVTNGKQVLEFLNKQAFDIILMDDQMPELSGTEATKLIRHEEKQTGQHIPIIAMTANAMAGDREKYLASGMDGYVSKPINREVLYNEIITLMKKKKEA